MQHTKTAPADHLAAVVTILALALTVPLVGVLMIPAVAFAAFGRVLARSAPRVGLAGTAGALAGLLSRGPRT
jgi:hypothetical protein